MPRVHHNLQQSGTDKYFEGCESAGMVELNKIMLDWWYTSDSRAKAVHWELLPYPDYDMSSWTLWDVAISTVLEGGLHNQGICSSLFQCFTTFGSPVEA